MRRAKKVPVAPVTVTSPCAPISWATYLANRLELCNSEATCALLALSGVFCYNQLHKALSRSREKLAKSLRAVTTTVSANPEHAVMSTTRAIVPQSALDRAHPCSARHLRPRWPSWRAPRIAPPWLIVSLIGRSRCSFALMGGWHVDEILQSAAPRPRFGSSTMCWCSGSITFKPCVLQQCAECRPRAPR